MQSEAFRKTSFLDFSALITKLTNWQIIGNVFTMLTIAGHKCSDSGNE